VHPHYWKDYGGRGQIPASFLRLCNLAGLVPYSPLRPLAPSRARWPLQGKVAPIGRTVTPRDPIDLGVPHLPMGPEGG
jgi:hypothetical protein